MGKYSQNRINSQNGIFSHFCYDILLSYYFDVDDKPTHDISKDHSYIVQITQKSINIVFYLTITQTLTHGTSTNYLNKNLSVCVFTYRYIHMVYKCTIYLSI